VRRKQCDARKRLIHEKRPNSTQFKSTVIIRESKAVMLTLAQAASAEYVENSRSSNMNEN